MDDETANVSETILTSILQWRVSWLDEQRQISQPPPICRTQPQKLKITYSNYKEYETTFVPLLMHEIWAQVFEEWAKLQCELNGGTPMDIDDDNPFPVIPTNSCLKNKPQANSRFQTSLSPRQIWTGIVDYKIEGQFQCSIRCQYLVESGKLSNHLKLIGEGDLVRLDLTCVRETSATSQIYDLKIPKVQLDNTDHQLTLFAYVVDVSSERLTKYSNLSECFVTRPAQNHHIVNYQVVIARRPLKVKLTAPAKMSMLYYLKPMIRQIESVGALKESVLASDILDPKHITCKLSIPTVVEIKSPYYNDMQFKAIIGANEALVRSIPKIQLIQGPPGTGKTHTLIGIIKHFYSNWIGNRLPKVLICAPSNGAIDEVARRLYKEREFLKSSPFKRSLRMVRVGHPDQINESVKVISIDELVEANATFKVQGMKKKHSSRISDLEEQLSECDTEISNLRFLKRFNEIPTLEMKIAALLKELEASKASEDLSTKREASEAAKKNIRYELIKNADVILTTLNSCQRHPLDVLFKGSNPELSFHCVIVDEASQCCEPELLMPLCYKISRMILIGDPMQLPATVISRYASQFDFGRSLFERFFMHFGKYEPSSPIAMLTEQYRMHPDICSFPSRLFYDGRLISSTVIDPTYPIKPYLIYDLKHGQESKSEKSSIENETEASFVRNLLVAAMTKVPENSSIGVITPYKGQRRLLTNKIQALQSERQISVDVNTVDGFQGQEKDIIILSCVRSFDAKSSNSIGFLRSVQRINVALTRAKHSLIIVVSAKSVSSDKTWLALIEDARRRNLLRSFDRTPSCKALEGMIVNGYQNQPSKLVRSADIDNVANGYQPEFVIPMDID